MKNYKNILLSPTSTIKQALQIIDSGAMKIAIVVDKNEKLVGTLTDGDIRRGLLGSLGLDDVIESIIFKTPTVCKIDDTKEKILEIAVEKKLYQIPIVDNDGKLVGIEEVDELLKPKQKTNKVVLMVGGLGTRLRPLTNTTPKPMLKVGDKPILETIISNFKKYGFREIILSVSYKAEIIEEYFGDGKKFGVNIEYIHEEKRMGTAGSLSFIREKLNEPFFVMNGDLLTNINFEHMMDYHAENDSMATMGVREYDFQVPYGVVNIDGINIKSIEEKPVHNFYVSGGVYVLSKDVLKYIPQNEYFDMPTLFEKIIEDDEKSISFPIREYWLDIGRMEEFEKANNEYSKVFLMYKKKTFLAIIPARGGSKRLPRKNVLDLNGKPLIAHSIEAGLNSKYIDKVLVTSDDDEILSISKKYGADTIQRSDELASDTATTFDAIKHAVDNCEKYDYIVLLQATSPLRNEKHIDEAIELLELKNADAVVSVCEMDHSPLWSNTLDDNLSMKGFLKEEVLNKRSQDLEKYYRLNGAIYICKTEKLLEEKSFFLKDDIFAYGMDRESSIDIDTELDYKFVSFLMKEN